jgi:hypothetical protein
VFEQTGNIVVGGVKHIGEMLSRLPKELAAMRDIPQ